MPDHSVTRREFARRLTAGTSLALGSWAVADGNEPAESRDGAAKEPGAATGQTSDAPPPEPEDFQLAALLQQYPGQHLTAEMLAGIRADLQRHRRQGERLRTVGLGNSDEPATTFRAWRKE